MTVTVWPLPPGWPLTWKTWKSQGIPKWLGKRKKVRGNWKQCHRTVQLPLTQLILESLTVSFCTCYSHNALNVRSWKHSDYLALSSRVKQRLLTITLNSISMNLCLPYWKVRGISNVLESGQPVPCNYCLSMSHLFCWALTSEWLTWQPGSGKLVLSLHPGKMWSILPFNTA